MKRTDSERLGSGRTVIETELRHMDLSSLLVDRDFSRPSVDVQEIL